MEEEEEEETKREEDTMYNVKYTSRCSRAFVRSHAVRKCWRKVDNSRRTGRRDEEEENKKERPHEDVGEIGESYKSVARRRRWTVARRAFGESSNGNYPSVGEAEKANR